MNDYRQAITKLACLVIAFVVFAGLACNPPESARFTELASSPPESARSADAFVDSIGTNIHVGYAGTVYYSKWDDVVKPKLDELGVRHVRDGAYLSNDQAYDSAVYSRYKELAALGIRANLIVDPRTQNLRSIDEGKIRRIAEMAGNSLESFEGPNEYEYSGDDNWANVLRAYQRDLYAATKNNPSTAGLPVIGPSFGSAKSVNAVGKLCDSVDYDNMHNYFSARHPGTSGWGAGGYGSVAYNIDLAKKMCGSKPVMSTETGYHNAVGSMRGHLGVPEAIAGKYMPRVFLEHFNRGISRTYSYEFIDLLPKADAGSNFGLLRNDGTEKPAYSALRNLIALLEDPGPEFDPGSLKYSLSGDTKNIHHALLQKREGRFYLVLWLEVPAYNPNTEQSLSVPTQRVRLKLDTPIEGAKTYLPNSSTAPTKRYAKPTQLALEVPDYPLVVELTPETVTPEPTKYRH
jgi:hypothetical protein